jgi:predicted TIM-barrel fold metal-dependent hydrolase
VTQAPRGIDSHSHVFARDLPLARNRRYTPGYDATLSDYLAMLDTQGLSHGVLVQPSFLGTDNSYLVRALRQAPDRLRGVAVVDRGADEAELDRLREAGCVGVRLNLVGRANPSLDEFLWHRHLSRIVAQGWHVEVQAEAPRLPAVMPPLLDAGARVVVDHFGLPVSPNGVADPGFRYLLEASHTGRVWVKLSAAYRLGSRTPGEEIARAAVPLLRKHFGAQRLLWGTDWPHTQHEDAVTAADVRRSIEAWLPDADERRIVLTDTPAALFGFAPTSAVASTRDAPIQTT